MWAILAESFRKVLFDATAGTTCEEKFPGILDGYDNLTGSGMNIDGWSIKGSGGAIDVHHYTRGGETPIPVNVLRDFELLMKSLCKDPAVLIAAASYAVSEAFAGSLLCGAPVLIFTLLLIGVLWRNRRCFFCCPFESNVFTQGMNELSEDARNKLTGLSNTYQLPLDKNNAAIRDALQQLKGVLESEIRELQGHVTTPAIAPKTPQSTAASAIPSESKRASNPLSLDHADEEKAANQDKDASLKDVLLVPRSNNGAREQELLCDKVAAEFLSP